MTITRADAHDRGVTPPLPPSTEDWMHTKADAEENRPEPVQMCAHEDTERLSVCCGRPELGETQRCSDCKEGTGFERVCDCGAVLPDTKYM